MIARATTKVSHQTLKDRRLQIEQGLAAFGLVRGPRRVFRNPTTSLSEESRAPRLCRALGDLGPIFSSYGLYLSARADLLPAADCLELAMIPDRAAVTPPPLVDGLLRDELKPSAREALTLEEKPIESRLLFQSHRGVLSDGRQVMVKLIHPETDQFPADLDLLYLLRDAFVGAGISESALRGAEVDFRRSLEQEMNFLNEAKALEQVSQDAEEHDELVVPQVYQHLGSSRILTVEQLNGFRLDRLLSSIEREVDTRLLLTNFGFDPRELARLLCEVWLRQALLCRYFPVASLSTNLAVLPGKKLVFTGGTFAAIPAGAQANLWDYLIAAANENAENACSHLLKEMTRTGTSIRDGDVRQRFKQAMPFRDGGWNGSSDCQSLAELLFLQWRLASECGYQPLTHLPAFYRGLFSIADVARRVAPGIDPLREGLRDLRLLGGVNQFRDMISLSEFADQFDRYAAMMVDLPRSMDEVLTNATEAESGTGSRREVGSDNRPRDRGFSRLVAVMLLVVAAFLLLSRYASAVADLGTDRVIAIAFVAVSALMLLVAASRG